jgi:hypothetical protein
MMHTAKRWAIAFGVTGVLALAGAAAGTPTLAGLLSGTGAIPSAPLAFGDGPKGAQGCTDDSTSQQAPTGGTVGQICQGAGLSFIGPSIGQVASVMGATVIGPANVNSTVSAGNGAG